MSEKGLGLALDENKVCLQSENKLSVKFGNYLINDRAYLVNIRYLPTSTFKIRINIRGMTL